MNFYDLNLGPLGGLKPDAVILAEGEFPTHEIPLKILRDVAPHLVVCDGAIRNFMKFNGRTVDCVVGDGDSLPKDIQEIFEFPHLHLEEQETNDLTKSVRYCLANGWKRIVILGATGRREDHSIGNIFLLPTYLNMGAEVIMMSNRGIFIPFTGEFTLTLPVGSQVSFFSIDHTPMTCEDVLYPFKDRVFRELWEATLNQTVAPVVKISTTGRGLIYATAEIKPLKKN